MTKRFAVLLMVFAGLAGAGTAIAQTKAAPAQKEGDKIVAVINGETLTHAEFEHMWNELTPEMQANYEQHGGKLQFLGNYIRKELVVQQAITDGYDKRPEVKMDLAEARNDAIFDHYIRDELSKEVLSDKDVKAYYDARPEEFTEPAMIEARHIIVTPSADPVTNSTGDNATTDAEAKAKIEKLERELKGHPDLFASYAKKYSEDGTAATGGDLGWFGRGRMDSDFEKAAFALQPGQMSGIVKTKYGYHLILVEKRRPKRVKPFSEVQVQLRRRLVKDKFQDLLAVVQKLSQQLTAKSHISVNQDNM